MVLLCPSSGVLLCRDRIRIVIRLVVVVEVWCGGKNHVSARICEKRGLAAADKVALCHLSLSSTCWYPLFYCEQISHQGVDANSNYFGRRDYPDRKKAPDTDEY